MTSKSMEMSPLELVGFSWHHMIEPEWVSEEPYGTRMLRDARPTATASYRPLATATALFRNFANLDGSEESFAEFARQYGTIGGWHEPEASTSLRAWQEQHEWISNAVRLWDAARMGLPESVIGRIIHLRPVGAEQGLYLERESRPGEPWPGEPWQALGAGPWGTFPNPAGPRSEMQMRLDAVRTALELAVNYALIDLQVRPGLTRFEGQFRDEHDAGLRLTFSVPSLAAGMWLQLALAVNGNREYRVCPVCHNWWDATESRSDRQTCSDRCRKRRSRQPGEDS